MRYDTPAKVMLFLGFLGLGTATMEAYQSPATGYELSIYAGTPGVFWALSSFALLISMAVVFAKVSRHVRMLGGFLGGLTMTAIVALPLIRGYFWVGTGDSLSHLGTAGDMNAGLIPLTQNRYPVVHPLGSVLHDATGLALPRSMLVLVVVFIVCFFLFVPLTVRELTGDIWATYIGLFSGLLLLPLNHLSPSIYIHPTSQALMFAPVMLFVFFVMYRQRIARHSLMFLVLAPMFVLLHPQQAANLLLFFGAIAGLQVVYDVLSGYRLERRAEWVLSEVVFFAAVFWMWVRNLGTFWSSLENVYMIPFTETTPAETSVTRGISLEAVGGSLSEVFIKLFLVSLFFAILTAVLVLLVIRSSVALRSRYTLDTLVPDGGTDRMLPLFVVGGLFWVLLMFLLFVIGGISDQYFRHLGMLMVFGTILGSIELARRMRYLSRLRSNSTARRSLALVLLVCLALSMPVVFSSPYIYYSSDHVSEMQMSGYETTFAHQNGSILFDDVRSTTSRHGNAILGREIPSDAYYPPSDELPEFHDGVPDRFYNHSLPSYYDQRIYIPVPEADRAQDADLWRGFRFSHEDFAYLDSDPAINKIQSNGGYDLYLVTPTDNSSGDKADDRPEETEASSIEDRSAERDRSIGELDSGAADDHNPGQADGTSESGGDERLHDRADGEAAIDREDVGVWERIEEMVGSVLQFIVGEFEAALPDTDREDDHADGKSGMLFAASVSSVR